MLFVGSGQKPADAGVWAEGQEVCLPCRVRQKRVCLYERETEPTGSTHPPPRSSGCVQFFSRIQSSLTLRRGVGWRSSGRRREGAPAALQLPVLQLFPLRPQEVPMWPYGKVVFIFRSSFKFLRRELKRRPFSLTTTPTNCSFCHRC